MSNAAELLIETLLKCGVDTIFGLPGDGINGIMEAIRTRQQKIRFIQVRHEESAAFMAAAHAKLYPRRPADPSFARRAAFAHHAAILTAHIT